MTSAFAYQGNGGRLCCVRGARRRSPSVVVSDAHQDLPATLAVSALNWPVIRLKEDAAAFADRASDFALNAVQAANLHRARMLTAEDGKLTEWDAGHKQLRPPGVQAHR